MKYIKPVIITILSEDIISSLGVVSCGSSREGDFEGRELCPRR